MVADSWKVLEIRTLGRADDDTARQLLEKAAWQVQPIMRKRQWTVKQLSEFLPSNPNLLGLNVNRGAEVKIRLRRAGDGGFYDFNHVLGTMLHELVHIVHGPHNAAFYKLLDELWEEAEALMDKGQGGSGAGFDAASVGRLGAHSFIPQHNPPEHMLRAVAAKAAEARAQRQQLLPRGPQRVGGASGWAAGLTPAQAAAAAAERRARDNLWCANGTTQDSEQLVLLEQAGAGAGGAGSSSSNSGNGPKGTEQQSLQQQQQPPGPPDLAPGAAVAVGTNDEEPGNSHGNLQRQFAELVRQRKRARSSTLPVQPGCAPAPAAAVGRSASMVVDLTADSEDEEDDLGGATTGAAPGTSATAAAGVGGASRQQQQQQRLPLSAAAAVRQRWRSAPCLCCAPSSFGASAAEGSCDQGWVCSMCTLHNTCQVLQCAACYSVRPTG